MINEPALLSMTMETLKPYEHLVTFSFKVVERGEDAHFAFAVPVGRALTTVSISSKLPRPKGLAGIARSVREWFDLEVPKENDGNT